MTKFEKIINGIAIGITVVLYSSIIVFVALFSTQADIVVEENVLQVDGIEVVKRKANQNVSFYSENADKNLTFYVIVAFDLYDLEKEQIYYTVSDEKQVYFITVNSNEEATVNYK